MLTKMASTEFILMCQFSSNLKHLHFRLNASKIW